MTAVHVNVMSIKLKSYHIRFFCSLKSIPVDVTANTHFLPTQIHYTHLIIPTLYLTLIFMHITILSWHKIFCTIKHSYLHSLVCLLFLNFAKIFPVGFPSEFPYVGTIIELFNIQNRRILHTYSVYVPCIMFMRVWNFILKLDQGQVILVTCTLKDSRL